MLTALKRWFRSDDEVIADAERVATTAFHGGLVPLPNLAFRHEALVARLEAKGMDPATVLLLIQLFGPLLVKLLERWLARTP